MTSVNEATVTIVNELGMHARAATVFVQKASEFASEIFITKDGREINGKSIMGVLMLVASKGTQIQLRTDGPDSQAALDALIGLVADKFGEER